jgi:hypothetical protein
VRHDGLDSLTLSSSHFDPRRTFCLTLIKLVGACGPSLRLLTRRRPQGAQETVDCPPVADGAATVSTSALALHLDCSRTYIGKLEAEGVILRQGDGLSLDRSRVAYLRYLRRERQQSPRVEADADLGRICDSTAASHRT